MSPDIVGAMGEVTVEIGGGSNPGEVYVGRGTARETYIAYSDEPLPVGASVLVTNDLGDRRLAVIPWARGTLR